MTVLEFNVFATVCNRVRPRSQRGLSTRRVSEVLGLCVRVASRACHALEHRGLLKGNRSCSRYSDVYRPTRNARLLFNRMNDFFKLDDVAK